MVVQLKVGKTRSLRSVHHVRVLPRPIYQREAMINFGKYSAPSAQRLAALSRLLPSSNFAHWSDFF
jgi:hypothetical protein